MAKSEAPDLLVSAWTILAERGWDGYSPVLVAEQTGLSLAEVQKALPDRSALLTLITERADAAMVSFPENEFV
ncbi:MAG: hypothetical protein ACFB3T_10670, partial [Geminicoccaceae bacterium]